MIHFSNCRCVCLWVHMCVYTVILSILCMGTKRSLMRLSQSGGQSGGRILSILPGDALGPLRVEKEMAMGRVVVNEKQEEVALKVWSWNPITLESGEWDCWGPGPYSGTASWNTPRWWWNLRGVHKGGWLEWTGCEGCWFQEVRSSPGGWWRCCLQKVAAIQWWQDLAWRTEYVFHKWVSGVCGPGSAWMT